MAGKAAAVRAQIKRNGISCVVTWPENDLDPEMATGDSTERTWIKPGQRTFITANGVPQFVQTGLMPSTKRDLQGATVSWSGRSYVVNQVVAVIDGGSAILQRVTLG